MAATQSPRPPAPSFTQTGDVASGGRASDRDRLARVVLSRLAEPGHRDLADLVRVAGAEQALDGVIGGDVPAALRRITDRQLAQLAGDPWEVAERFCDAGHRAGARLIVPGDDEWPPQLADLAAISCPDKPHTHAPLCLWVVGHGSLRAVLDRAVAVVGARAATPYGEHVATELAHALAERGWTVVSCTSSGVNGAAHRGALAGAAAGAAASVGVLPGGIDVPYPHAHATLLEKITEHGLLISERPPGTAALPYRFLTRNRLIAATTHGTVVVEAGLRSGARNTADWARRLGRTVMAVPGQITSAMSIGCHAEIAAGTATLVTSAADLLAQLGDASLRAAPPPPVGQPANPPGDGPPTTPSASPAAAPASRNGDGGGTSSEVDRVEELDPQLRRVLAAVPHDRPAPLEVIAAQADLSPIELRRTLPDLVSREMVDHHPTGYRLAAGQRATGLSASGLPVDSGSG